MGIEIVFIELLVIQTVATALFSRFESETPATRRMAKWFVIDAITIGLYFGIGLPAMLFLLALAAIGTLTHLQICRKHGFDPLKATPRKAYYAFRGWTWEE